MAGSSMQVTQADLMKRFGYKMHLYRPDLEVELQQSGNQGMPERKMGKGNEKEQNELPVGRKAEILGIRGVADDQNPEFEVKSSSTFNKAKWHFASKMSADWDVVIREWYK